MPEEHSNGVRSTASILGHPIHPMLVPFPIAFLVALLFTDLAFQGTADPFWARASLWLAGAGLATGLLAAVFGLIDFTTVRRARQHIAGWVHAVGNVAAMLATAINLGLRFGDQSVVPPGGVILSAVTVLILVITGWYGGELAYRHMIGVTGHKGTQNIPHREETKS